MPWQDKKLDRLLGDCQKEFQGGNLSTEKLGTPPYLVSFCRDNAHDSFAAFTTAESGTIFMSDPLFNTFWRSFCEYITIDLVLIGSGYFYGLQGFHRSI